MLLCFRIREVEGCHCLVSFKLNFYRFRRDLPWSCEWPVPISSTPRRASIRAIPPEQSQQQMPKKPDRKKNKKVPSCWKPNGTSCGEFDSSCYEKDCSCRRREKENVSQTNHQWWSMQAKPLPAKPSWCLRFKKCRRIFLHLPAVESDFMLHLSSF